MFEAYGALYFRELHNEWRCLRYLFGSAWYQFLQGSFERIQLASDGVLVLIAAERRFESVVLQGKKIFDAPSVLGCDSFELRAKGNLQQLRIVGSCIHEDAHVIQGSKRMTFCCIESSDHV